MHPTVTMPMTQKHAQDSPIKPPNTFWSSCTSNGLGQTYSVSQTKELLEKLYTMPVTPESTKAIRSYESFLKAAIEFQQAFNVKEDNFQKLWSNTLAAIDPCQGDGYAPQLLSTCSELRQTRGRTHYQKIQVKSTPPPLPTITRQLSASARVETVYPTTEPEVKKAKTRTTRSSNQRRSTKRTGRK